MTWDLNLNEVILLCINSVYLLIIYNSVNTT